MMKGDLEKATSTLKSLRSADDVSDEMNAIQSTIEEEAKNRGKSVFIAFFSFAFCVFSPCFLFVGSWVGVNLSSILIAEYSIMTSLFVSLFFESFLAI